MAKIVEGVALIAGAVILSVVTAGALAAGAAWAFADATALFSTAVAVGVGGISLTLSGIAQALQPGLSAPFSVAQPAAPRQIVYGQARVAGVIVYMSTTNNGHDLNHVIVWAGHQVQSVDSVYLDGRAAHVPANGGQDSGGTYYDDSGNSYTFGSLLHIWHSLGPVPGTYFSDLGGRDSKWGSNCTLDGLAASYIRCHFDTNTFPEGRPQIKANVHGKNTIYDPRTKAYGYSENAALIIADFLCNSEYGVGCAYANEIDEPQLIAAANLCDELITLANGLSEPRYTINGFFDTNSTAGDILDAMLQACEGRISYTGGRWKIFPAAWWPSGLTFGQNDLAGPVKWIPSRKYRDLVNAVRGTYVSPKYPYTVTGYNRDNKDANIFSGQWQPADYPNYAQDMLHGYPSDANLAQDGGVKLYNDRPYRFVTSVAQAQRLAKIFLLRNRFQGSGTLTMQLSAYQTIAQDVIQMSLPALGWSNKYLEVQTLRFVPKLDQHSDEEGSSGPTLYVELDVIETDPSIYLWSTAEELGPANAPSPTLYRVQQVNPPTSLALESGADSAVIGADGVVIPRIHVTWIEPDDPFFLSGGYINLQWQKVGTGVWNNVGHLGPTITDHFINGVVAGQQYIVQIQAVRSNGAGSGWMQAGPHTVSSQASVFSYASVTGLGALATSNFVDFATGSVINKTASNLTYSTGLSVEALRPAEPNAQQVAGKSIDLLADGTVYVRIKSNQASGGAITGLSYGHNVLANPSFEKNDSGSAIADDWVLAGASNPPNLITTAFDASIPATSGYKTLLISANSGLNYPSGLSACYVASSRVNVQGGTPIFFGGSINYYRNTTPPAGMTLAALITVLWTDCNDTVISEAIGATVSSPIGWTPFTAYATAPQNAAFLRVRCIVQVQCSSAMNAGSGIIGDFHFDDCFCTFQLLSSGILNSQGSIMPNQPINVTFSYTNSSCTLTWTAQSVLRSDASTLTVPSGSRTFSGLAASTTYYTYAYIRISDGTLQFTNGSPPPTSPNAVFAAQTGLDGRISVGPISFTTLAASNGGSGGGTGGGGSVCPEADELVELRDRGPVKAVEIKAGDWIKGWSFPSNREVYRQIVQVRTQTAAAWRIVEGHKVSPCEAVYHGGQWMPAFRAPSAVDMTVGTKVLISVDAGEEDEHNYYLISGTPLLIHNYQQLPC